MKYIKQLDSIRAIAVLCVIIEHWFPTESRLNFFVNGSMGVNIFFVLSGFLISGILINNKIKAESGVTPLTSIFKNFYARRTLRIFPIYYLTIFFLLIFHASSNTNIRANFVYFLTYTSNLYFYKIQAWDGIVSHLWTLAVEEQFYIIWPFVILLIPKKYLLHIIIAFIAIGLISQRLWDKTEFDNVLVNNNFDSFGLGALLSWVLICKPQKLYGFYRIVTVTGIISAVLLFAKLFLDVYSPFSESTLHSLVALWIIAYIVEKGRKNAIQFKFILENRILIFLGKISYGIYLYHLILPHYAYKYTTLLNNLISIPGTKQYMYLFYIENFIIVVAGSWISWKLIEQPILRLKKYFHYLGE